MPDPLNPPEHPQDEEDIGEADFVDPEQTLGYPRAPESEDWEVSQGDPKGPKFEFKPLSPKRSPRPSGPPSSAPSPSDGSPSPPQFTFRPLGQRPSRHPPAGPGSSTYAGQADATGAFTSFEHQGGVIVSAQPSTPAVEYHDLDLPHINEMPPRSRLLEVLVVFAVFTLTIVGGFYQKWHAAQQRPPQLQPPSQQTPARESRTDASTPRASAPLPRRVLVLEAWRPRQEDDRRAG